MTEISQKMSRFVASRAYDHYKGERWEAAEMALDLLIDMESEVAEYWTLRGIVKRELEKHEESLNSLQKAHELDPADRNTLINLAEVLVINGKIREGVELLAKIFNGGYDAELSPAAQDAVTRRAGFNIAALRRLSTARKKVAELSEETA